MSAIAEPFSMTSAKYSKMSEEENTSTPAIQTKKKREYRRIQFSSEDEEALIEFVKTNQELYDPKHELYKNRDRKTQLWQKIASDLNKTGKFNFDNKSNDNNYIEKNIFGFSK